MSERGWEKMGLIFRPAGDLAWMASHAALPLVYAPGGRWLRVYCCGRDVRQRSRIGFFELKLSDPPEVRMTSEEPVLDIGSLGAFDDSGVTPGSIVRTGDRVYLYYTGWSLGVTVPFYFAIGLAESRDGGASFRRVSIAPVLGRTQVDPYLTASPAVLVENGRWRMWYVSGREWRLEQGLAKHYYHIRYAESDDGVKWNPSGRVCVDFASSDEFAFGRPWVLRDAGIYRMWYSYRGQRYRIGYAESLDGLVWNRKDDRAGIGTSEDGWDSEMVTYPVVFDHDGRRYMLYNGNGYGASGIGLARAS